MPRIKVLLVEDDDANRDMLRRRLVKRGFDVVVAIDGEQAVAMAELERPDIILMDICLPRKDGWTATREIKSNLELAPMPIIALTAHAMVGDRERALAVGCDEYDTKPVDLARLIDKIEALVSHHR